MEEFDCAKCGNTFERETGAPGPKPKNCPDCKKPKSEEQAPQEQAPTRPRSVVQLENNLKIQLSGMAIMLGLADPWLSQHLMRNAEQAARVHANLAASNPKIRKALERSVEMAGWGPVIMFWGVFLVPVIAHYRTKQESQNKAPGPHTFGHAGTSRKDESAKVMPFPGRPDSAAI